MGSGLFLCREAAQIGIAAEGVRLNDAGNA